MHPLSRTSNIKTHILLLLQTLLILLYLILWRGSISLCPSAPRFVLFFVLLCFFFSRWHVSVWIISLLQDAGALTIFMYVCTHHTQLLAHTAKPLPPSSPCLMSARLFQRDACDERDEEEWRREGRMCDIMCVHEQESQLWRCVSESEACFVALERPTLSFISLFEVIFWAFCLFWLYIHRETGEWGQELSLDTLYQVSY